MRSSCRGSAGRVPWQRPTLAEAVSLDMTGYWRPTVRTYLGRITKARILEAVREAIGDEAAIRMAVMKKQDMAEAAEQLLAATGWLPPSMRTPRTVPEATEPPHMVAVTQTKDPTNTPSPPSSRLGRDP